MVNEPDEDASGKVNKTFDLEERTARFGEAVVAFCQGVQLNPITTPLVSQLVRSGTSVGANYLEANDAESKKDFRHKIALCRKESKETKHWLRMIVSAEATHRDSAARLWKEAKELNLIFGAPARQILAFDHSNIRI
jgi:four helix bundle protein